MADVVLILGAGCSLKCGAPLMNDFLRVATSLYRNGLVKDRAQDFQRVFEVISRLQTVHSKSQLDTDNIESLFSAIDMAKTIGRLPGYRAEEIDQVLASLRWLIVRTLEESMVFTLEDGNTLKGHGEYENFAETLTYLLREHSPRLSVAVLTFNYDVALELALMRARIPFTYGLEDGPAPDQKTVRVLKLHGSLNWAAEGQRIHVWHPREFATFAGIHEYRGGGRPVVKVGSGLQDFFSRRSVKVEPTPALVPPTWNKGTAGSDLAKVWRSAAAELSDAEYLYVIGYSMPSTDQFFPYLYALGTVGDKPFRDVGVMNPDPEVTQRFEALLGPAAKRRLRFIDRTWFDGAAGRLKGFFEEG